MTARTPGRAPARSVLGEAVPGSVAVGVPYKDASIATLLLTNDNQEWLRKSQADKARLADEVRSSSMAAKDNSGAAGANKTAAILNSTKSLKVFCWEHENCYQWMQDSEKDVYARLLDGSSVQRGEVDDYVTKAKRVWSNYETRFGLSFKAVPTHNFLTYVCAIKAYNDRQSWLDCTYQAMSYMSDQNPNRARSFQELATITRTVPLFFANSDEKLLGALGIPDDGARDLFIYIVAACYRLLVVLIAGHYLQDEWLEYLQVIALKPPMDTDLRIMPANPADAKKYPFPVKLVKYHSVNAAVAEFTGIIPPAFSDKFTDLDAIHRQVLSNVIGRSIGVAGARGANQYRLVGSFEDSVEFDGPLYEKITVKLSNGEEITIDLNQFGSSTQLGEGELQNYHRIFDALQNYNKSSEENKQATRKFVEDALSYHFIAGAKRGVYQPNNEQYNTWYEFALKLADNAGPLFTELGIDENTATAAKPSYSSRPRERGLMNVTDLLNSLDDED